MEAEDGNRHMENNTSASPFFAPSGGKRHAPQAGGHPPHNQQVRAKRKRTVSMSTDDLPLSALGHAMRSAQEGEEQEDIYSLGMAPSSTISSTNSAPQTTMSPPSFAPLSSPFGGAATSSPSALSSSFGASFFGERSGEAEALLAGDSLNNSLDAAYWHKFLSTDGEELERESQQVTAEALGRSYAPPFAMMSGVKGEQGTAVMPPIMYIPTAHTHQALYNDREGVSGMPPPPLHPDFSPHHQQMPPPLPTSSSSASSTPISSPLLSTASSSSFSFPSSTSSGQHSHQQHHLPLLSPKPDPTPPVPDNMRGSSSGLTASRSGDTPKGMLARINLLEQTIDGQLKSLKYLQSNLMEDLSNRAELTKVQQTQEEVSKHLTHSIDTLNNLNDTQILVAIDAHRLSALLDKLDLHAQRLRIYQEELTHALSGHPYVATAALIITQQPFPCTIKQGKSIDEPVEVTLLTGAKVEIQKMGPVKAEMLSDDTTPVPKKKNTEPPIQNGVQQMREEGVALFRNMMFPHGSRVKTVNIRFSQELTINGRVMTIHSEPSKPFIVMTNHGQRSATEGKLLKKSRAFDRPSIPWPAFANALQLHYLKETKQDPLKPLRILSYRDLEYIRHYKFGGKSTISSKEYDSFWEWFGSILYKIRNPQKHILPMWLKGMIYGLISREECDSLMQMQNALPGSFLIRFSDSCAGQFVVVYVNQISSDSGQPTAEVKHYLLQSEVEKRGTLPDFLRSCDKLRFLLVRECESEAGGITLKPVPKDNILESYYSKEHAANLPPGYDVSGL